MRVAVIGGGVAGLSAAARLAMHTSVTVYEAEEHIGYHASGRSAAMFEESYGNATIRALNRASQPFLEEASVLAQRGLMMVALADEVPVFEADAADMGMDEISLEAAREAVPILASEIVRAAAQDGAKDIDTDKLLQTYARCITGAGGIVRTGAAVTAINRASGQWIVECGAVRETNDIVVNAAGAWADQVSALAGVTPIGLQPFRRSMARMAAPGGHDVRGWPMLFGPGERWYAKPDAGGWIVSPADEDPIEPMDAWADDMVLAEGLARYQAHVNEPVTRIETSWAGLRSFVPDRTLVIGPDVKADGFFWCAGQGGYGFQTSPAASQLLADLVMGREPALPRDVVQALSPARFDL